MVYPIRGSDSICSGPRLQKSFKRPCFRRCAITASTCGSCWDRENNPEPLHVELGGGFSGVRAAFIFFDNGSETPEKIYFGSHEQPANSVISQVYDETIYYGYSREGLTPHLRKAVHDRNPQEIGVNTSHTLPEADGLTVGLKNFLVETIGPEYASRIVSAELVVARFPAQPHTARD